MSLNRRQTSVSDSYSYGYKSRERCSFARTHLPGTETRSHLMISCISWLFLTIRSVVSMNHAWKNRIEMENYTRDHMSTHTPVRLFVLIPQNPNASRVECARVRLCVCVALSRYLQILTFLSENSQESPDRVRRQETRVTVHFASVISFHVVETCC